MNLVIDIGNSRVKIAVFDFGQLVFSESLERISIAKLKRIIYDFQTASAIISTVTNTHDSIEKFLKKKIRLIKISPSTSIPFTNKYKTPSTLGTDRISNLAAAIKLYPQKNILIISAGTCITYDLLTSDGIYYGGNITPGLDMRFKALNTYTAQLPLVKKKMISNLVGTSTETSILTGVITGTRAEMEKMIENYKKEYSNLKTILTGGDAIYFESTIKCKIFAVPHLTLYGLNEILSLNDKENF